MRMPIAFGALSCLALVACNDPFSNDDLEFLKALPHKEQVEIAVPGGTATSTSGLGHACELAKSYLDAKKTSDQLNAMTGSILGIIEAVEQYPPTVREDDQRVWAFPDQGIDYLVTIKRVRTATSVKTTSTSTRTEIPEHFEYSIVARHQSTTEMHLPLVGGAFAPSESLETGMGVVFLDLENLRALKGGGDDRGLYYFGYDNRFDQQTIEVAIDLMIDPAHPFKQAEAGYRFHAEPSGEKAFFFGILNNIPDIQPDTGPETFVIVARWLADNRGRTDAIIQGGDLGDRKFFDVECWDPSFCLDFRFSNAPGAMNKGMLSDCAAELRENPH